MDGLLPRWVSELYRQAFPLGRVERFQVGIGQRGDVDLAKELDSGDLVPLVLLGQHPDTAVGSYRSL